jgi:hypothetical protein
MGLFSRKTKTDAVEFAQDFYDRFVFGSFPTTEIDFALGFADTNRRLIIEADASFAEVNADTFKDELLGLRLEMIGTAWTHKSTEEAALAVSEFTREYLISSQRGHLWEVMTEYNLALSESVTHGADPKTRRGRAKITFVNSMRVQLFDGWVAKGRDPEAVARVVNRFGSEKSWKIGITQGLLAIKVTRRLKLEGSNAIWERLAATSYGFYQGAKEALEEVTLTA